MDNASLFVLERMIEGAGGDSRDLQVGEQTWRDHPAEVARWTEITARGLAHAIVATLSIIDLEAIIVDGGFPEFVRDDLMARIEVELDGLDLQGIRRPGIVPGSFGSIARAVGAACLPLNKDYSIGGNALLQA